MYALHYEGGRLKPPWRQGHFSNLTGDMELSDIRQEVSVYSDRGHGHK